MTSVPPRDPPPTSEELSLARAQAQLAQAHDLLAAAIAAAGVAIWHLDLDSGALALSPGLHELLGQSAHDFRPTLDTVLDVVHPDDHDKAIQLVAHVTLSHRAGPVPLRLIHRAGGLRHVLAHAVLERAADGRPLRVLGTVADHEHALALARSERQSGQAELAHSLAHDFESLLGGLTLDLAGLRGQLARATSAAAEPGAPDVHATLDTLELTLSRASQLTARLRSFARPKPKAPTLAPFVPGLRAEANRRHILVVDDQIGVCRAVSLLLTDLGFRVSSACSASDALTIARLTPGRLDSLLTDVIMPDQDGPRLAEQVLALHPACQVVFMSVFPAQDLDSRGLPRHARLLSKPFSVHDLESALALLHHA